MKIIFLDRSNSARKLARGRGRSLLGPNLFNQSLPGQLTQVYFWIRIWRQDVHWDPLHQRLIECLRKVIQSCHAGISAEQMQIINNSFMGGHVGWLTIYLFIWICHLSSSWLSRWVFCNSITKNCLKNGSRKDILAALSFFSSILCLRISETSWFGKSFQRRK